jgi:hypothetical protein
MNLLNTLKVGDTLINHYINTETDATCFARSEDLKLLCVISRDALMTDGERPLGKFYLNQDGYWFFVFADDQGHYSYHLADRLETGNKDLIKAEAKVLKELVNRGKIIL